MARPLHNRERTTMKTHILKKVVFAIALCGFAVGLLAVPLTPTGETFSHRIKTAPIFERPITWTGTGGIDEGQSKALWSALEVALQTSEDAGIVEIEAFLA